MSEQSKPTAQTMRPDQTVSAGYPNLLTKIISVIRTKLRDHPELNRLIDGVETSDAEIGLAIVGVVSDWNSTPPLLGNVRFETFPSLNLLLQGAMIEIVESVILLQIRNQLNYNDGQAISGGLSDKAPILMQWVDRQKASYDAKKRQLKKALNINGALNQGGLASEYAIIDGLFLDI